MTVDPASERATAAAAAALHAAAAEARAASASIDAFSPRLNALVEQVVDIVGGSAQGVDRDMVNALSAAMHDLHDAVAHLSRASAGATAHDST